MPLVVTVLGLTLTATLWSKLLPKNFVDWLVNITFPSVSATQTTRSGFGSTDVSLTDTSESFGLPATADFMFALISSDEDGRHGANHGQATEEQIQ